MFFAWYGVLPAAVGIVLLPGGARHGWPNVSTALITLCGGVIFYGHANIATDERPVGLGKYIGELLVSPMLPPSIL